MTVVHADFSHLRLSDTGALFERYEGFQAGGGGLVAKEPLVREGANIRRRDDQTEIVFSESGGRLEIVLQLLGLPLDWKPFASLVLRLSAGDRPVRIEFSVIGARSLHPVGKTFAAGEQGNLEIDLVDLPIIAGNRPIYEPVALRFRGTWDGDAHERVLHLRDLFLEPADDSFSRVCIDRFGQRLKGEWPGKIRSTEDLAGSIDREVRELETMPGTVPTDRFGGWTEGPRFAPAPVFRVEQDDRGRWWYVTPEGNPFWSIGTTGVRLSFVTDATQVAGREFLYEELPDSGGPFGSAFLKGRYYGPHGDVDLPGNVHFYRWNVLRKWGSPERWRDHVLRRFRSWGFNSIGSWSEEIMLDQEQVPHTRFLRVRAGAPVAFGGGFPDVFDPRWPAYVDEVFARFAAPEKDNPWLIGYFVDNESHWRNMRLLEMEPGTPLRTEWLRCLQERYAELRRLNGAWGTSWDDWAQVRDLHHRDLPEEGQAQDDLTAFNARFAERYFRTVATLLKKHDPNHLYMGCRFVRVPPHDSIIAAAGRHCDVVSVNCYALYPDPEAFTDWHHKALGKPIVIGEHHLPLRSERQFPPLYRAFPADERRRFYTDFVRKWAELPFSLGCHWFQHADQPTTGRSTDGENQTVGFVDITDQPYRELVEAAREATASMYLWHRG